MRAGPRRSKGRLAVFPAHAATECPTVGALNRRSSLGWAVNRAAPKPSRQTETFPRRRLDFVRDTVASEDHESPRAWKNLDPPVLEVKSQLPSVVRTPA